MNSTTTGKPPIAMTASQAADTSGANKQVSLELLPLVNLIFTLIMAATQEGEYEIEVSNREAEAVLGFQLHIQQTMYLLDYLTHLGYTVVNKATGNNDYSYFINWSPKESNDDGF